MSLLLKGCFLLSLLAVAWSYPDNCPYKQHYCAWTAFYNLFKNNGGIDTAVNSFGKWNSLAWEIWADGDVENIEDPDQGWAALADASGTTYGGGAYNDNFVEWMCKMNGYRFWPNFKGLKSVGGSVDSSLGRTDKATILSNLNTDSIVGAIFDVEVIKLQKRGTYNGNPGPHSTVLLKGTDGKFYYLDSNENAITALASGDNAISQYKTNYATYVSNAYLSHVPAPERDALLGGVLPSTDYQADKSLNLGTDKNFVRDWIAYKLTRNQSTEAGASRMVWIKKEAGGKLTKDKIKDIARTDSDAFVVRLFTNKNAAFNTANHQYSTANGFVAVAAAGDFKKFYDPRNGHKMSPAEKAKVAGYWPSKTGTLDDAQAPVKKKKYRTAVVELVRRPRFTAKKKKKKVRVKVVEDQYKGLSEMQIMMKKLGHKGRVEPYDRLQFDDSESDSQSESADGYQNANNYRSQRRNRNQRQRQRQRKRPSSSRQSSAMAGVPEMSYADSALFEYEFAVLFVALMCVIFVTGAFCGFAISCFLGASNRFGFGKGNGYDTEK